jgi:hypothetical protein
MNDIYICIDVHLGQVHDEGADVLRDAPRFARGHGGLSQRVQQRGLAVVHVPHHRHHRRPRRHLPEGATRGSPHLNHIQGTLDIIQGTLDTIQGTLDIIQGTLDIV